MVVVAVVVMAIVDNGVGYYWNMENCETLD